MREEEILKEAQERACGVVVETDRDEDIVLVVPPVFENCIRVLDAGEQVIARGEVEKDETQGKRKRREKIFMTLG